MNDTDAQVRAGHAPLVGRFNRAPLQSRDLFDAQKICSCAGERIELLN